ncbi:MAG: hypothetical protein GF398_20110, partial [Chitinivibrionales bacterium]|nr:hypothetical protein [Chitinivibrionales bacterium]
MTVSLKCRLVFLPLVAAVCAQTHVGGVIAKTTRWTAEESPYIITGDIEIGRQANLIITPGTRILVGKPKTNDKPIEQYDHLDSHTVSIKIKGMLKCIGRRTNRITFGPLYSDDPRCTWYGIVFDKSFDDLTEIAFTDISGACHGIKVVNASPLIRNTVFENNNIGLHCHQKGNPEVYNCIMINNTSCGVRIVNSNPTINNSIIAFNRNNGVWSDGYSKMDFAYNCVFGNPDGNMLDCNPRYGIITQVNKNDDSTDFALNLHQDPTFAGSPA